MFQYPSKIEVIRRGHPITFNVSKICNNVLAIHEPIHAMKTTDGFTFGYIVYYNEYLHAYCLTTDDKPKPQLIYTSYLGPEEDITEADDDMITHIFHTVGLTVAQHSSYRNIHPAILDKETFQTIYDNIAATLERETAGSVTPYIVPMREIAENLRNFYGTMIMNLDSLNAKFEDQMNKAVPPEDT